MSKLSNALRKAGIKKLPKLKLRPRLLLCSNIPQPLHGAAPRVILGSKWWNETRQAAYASTEFRCLACGVPKHLALGHQWLEGHELYKINYQRGTMIYVETVPLCHYCHNYIHDGRMTAMVEKGELSAVRFKTIIQHGDRVLLAAGLSRPTHAQRLEAIVRKMLDGKVARWEKWRLVIDGKSYPPKFKTEAQWREAMK